MCPSCISQSSYSLETLKLILKEEHNILVWANIHNHIIIQPSSTSLWEACFQQLLLTDSTYLSTQGIFTSTNLLHHLLPFWRHQIISAHHQTHSIKHKTCAIISKLKHDPNTFLNLQNSTKMLLFQSLSSSFHIRFQKQLHVVETLEKLLLALSHGGVVVYLNSFPNLTENYCSVVPTTVIRSAVTFLQVCPLLFFDSIKQNKS